MNKCLNCGREVKNKFCNVSCQNSVQNAEKAKRTVLKRHGELKNFDVICNKCKNVFVKEIYEKDFNSSGIYYCSRKCANSKTFTVESNLKRKISNSIAALNVWKRPEFSAKRKIIIIKKCNFCNNDFETKNKWQKFCSLSCSSVNAGRISAQKRVLRSKNEIYFSELCKENFKDVKCNERMFNGWDADVIIEDLKVAVLWNGKWHYEKLGKKHSVLQTQNRDKIKISEIIKCGYKPYIIKDMGKHNKAFVKNEFEIFKLHKH